MQHLIYQHKTNYKYFKIIDWCKSKENDIWVNSYIYTEAVGSSSVAIYKYVLSIDSFHEKFKPIIDEEVLTDVKDSSSLLEMIRGEQFQNIFGKFKLF
jgi:uncharacterized protein YhbP (UPF0306 family)